MLNYIKLISHTNVNKAKIKRFAVYNKFGGFCLIHLT